MNKKHNAAQRVIDFFEGKGFYIILFLCVAAIGISGYVLYFAGFGETPDTQPQDYLLEEPEWTPQPIEDMTQDAAVAAGGQAEVVIETQEPSPSRSPRAHCCRQALCDAGAVCRAQTGKSALCLAA